MFILSEDSERTSGEDAQQSNITAGKAISEAVRTTLGPRGMDKMLVSDAGDVVITNDGATILDEMDIEHPAADMIVDVAQTQEDEIGDGTTTAAIIAGQLLAQAENLFEDDVHATTVVEGYHEAAELAHDAVDEMTLDVDVDDELLINVAESSMTGKGTGGVTAESLAQTVVGAVSHISSDEGVERDNITLQTQVGGSSSETELIQGIALDEEAVHETMPDAVENADIGLLDVELGVQAGDVDAEYSIENIDQLNAAMDAEESELKETAQSIVDSGVDVLFNSEEIDDRVASLLANEGVLAFDSLSDSDIRGIASATGARRVGALEDFESEEFGHADSIRTEAFADDELVFIEGGAAAESVTVLVRGGTEHVVDELERTLRDAVDVVSSAAETGSIVPGAGATEIAIAAHIRSEAAGISGRKQLAVEAFADAIDTVPRTLAENAGLDAIDSLVELRGDHDDNGRAGLIVDGQFREVGDPVEHGVVDPAAVKHEAIESATEAATMIARIDDVIAAE
ncbi:thermosome subunit alpha [Natronoarchaeum sp. GCM10025321]|uniref:thermosome subunit alpha n=1 Tax=Natronoarchaeum sp. GCM10025321 TaxID=3252684 RepID=UPI00360F3FA3